MKFSNLGLTLIEMMIAISILSILALAGIASYGSIQRKSQDTKTIGDIKEVQKALELYYSLNDTYPSELDDLVIGGTKTYLSTGELPYNRKTGDTYDNNYYPSPVQGTIVPSYCMCSYPLEQNEGGNAAANDSSCLYLDNGPYFCLEGSQ